MPDPPQNGPLASQEGGDLTAPGCWGGREGPARVLGDGCGSSSGACTCFSYCESGGYQRALQGGELLQRLVSYQRCGGLVLGTLFGVIAVAVHLWWCALRWLQPVHQVQVAVDWPQAQQQPHHHHHELGMQTGT